MLRAQAQALYKGDSPGNKRKLRNRGVIGGVADEGTGLTKAGLHHINARSAAFCADNKGV